MPPLVESTVCVAALEKKPQFMRNAGQACRTHVAESAKTIPQFAQSARESAARIRPLEVESLGPIGRELALMSSIVVDGW